MIAVGGIVAVAYHARAPHIVAGAVAAEIGRNSVQPRPQTLLGVELRIGAIGAQPGFLEKIERVVLIAGHAQQKPHDLTLVATERFLKWRRQIEFFCRGFHGTGYNPAWGLA